MAKSIAGLQQRLSRVKPWVLVAALLGAVLLVYYTVLGARYWQASRDLPAVKERILELTRSTRGSAPDEQALLSDLEARIQRLDELRGHFGYSQPDDLVAIVSATARETPLSLLSISVGEQQSKAYGDVDYRAQPMTLSLQGDLPSIYRFMALLHHKVPVAHFTSVKLSSGEEGSSGQVQVTFYVLPPAGQQGEAN